MNDDKSNADRQDDPESSDPKPEHFRVEGSPCQGYRFTPSGMPRAAIHITHGLAEHALRYQPLASALNAQGWIVTMHDQRGHGATAEKEEALGHFADKDGWRSAVDDLRKFVAQLKADHPDLPCVVFGHSMGSMITQDYLSSSRISQLAAAVLSGVAGPPPPLAHAGRAVARVERWRQGPQGRSAILRELGFGSYNRAFKPNRTSSDWLSKDPAEVDKYINDPLCGFDASNQFWIDMLDNIVEFNRPHRLAQIPKDLPIYVFAGDQDPVGQQGVGVRKLVDALRGAGVARVDAKLYPMGRHEMLNEINREEVVADLIKWLGDLGLPPKEE
ncbi:MAG: alpha/beta hydrolase [Myxococcota bacterium]